MTVQPTRDQLRALADAATPGPWEQVNDHRESRVIATGGEHWLWIADTGSVDSPQAQNDAEFIAAARTAVPQLLDQLDQAEHRIARLEAQTDIRGRAVVMYRERAREAEAERDEWRQTALDERAAALDALEQIKARDARAAHIWDEGWEQGMAYVTGMERGTDDEDLDHAIANPYRASETA